MSNMIVTAGVKCGLPWAGCASTELTLDKRPLHWGRPAAPRFACPAAGDCGSSPQWRAFCARPPTAQFRRGTASGGARVNGVDVGQASPTKALRY